MFLSVPAFFMCSPEAYSEPCQTSQMECFTKIINYLTIFAERSILDVWQGSEHASVVMD